MSREPGRIIRVMRERHGRDISMYDETFLLKSLDKRLKATGIDTAAAYCGHLRENAAEAEELVQSLHVVYSEFFRSPLAFALLEQVILPGLVEHAEKAGQKEIRVWSAACASGQEACSIAILLDELTAARAKTLTCRIFATDICEAELAAARNGVYDFAAVRNVRLKHIRGFFTQQGDRYRIIPRLKERIDFSAYDLPDDRSVCPPASIYGDFDLIFCSNLLYYYRQDIRHIILTKMHGCLTAKGYMVTDEAERAIVEQTGGFKAVAPPAAVFAKIT